MREPDSRLDGLRHPTWDLASPAQVRRRGDQLTQRRARAATAGLVAALAIPVAVATMIGRHEPADQTVTATPSARPSETSSSPSWLTSVPATFDLSRGLHGTQVATPGDDLMTRVTICGRARWVAGTPGDAVDTQAIVSSGPAGSRVERFLVLYPDDAAARSALDGLREWATSCTSVDDAGDLGLGGGVESWYGTAAGPDADALLAVRVGNAVLVDRAPWTSSSDDSGLDRLSVQAVHVVREMCVFAAEGCPNLP